MRRTLTVAALAAAMIAAPAWAQGNSGNAGGGGGPPAWAGGAGGGPGGGMNGAGPPIAPPGLSDDPAAAARAIADQRGQFGRDFGAERGSGQSDLTGPERAEFQRQRAAQYFANAQLRRQEAQQFSTAMRNGAQLPNDAAKALRAELRADMEAWRETFRVDRAEWQRLRDEWIADRDELTPEQWAQRRLDWFVFRDAWIASHREWAQARADD